MSIRGIGAALPAISASVSGHLMGGPIDYQGHNAAATIVVAPITHPHDL
jgi:hypothetical protein